MADVKIVVSAQDNASRVLSRVESALGSLRSVATVAAGSLGITGATLTAAALAAYVAFDNLVKKAGDFQDMAEKTGDTAQNIASLAVAADTAGTSMDVVVSASAKLTKNLTGVDDESKAAGAAIAALGLDLQAFKALAPADQFETAAKAINSFEDGSSKTSVAMALWGKTGAELLPFLKELGAEGGRQVILTQEQIEQADAYADRQAKLRSELGLYAQAIATQMLPAYSALTDALSDVAKEILGADSAAKKLGQGGEINAFAQNAALILADLADVAFDVGGAFRFIGDNLGAMAAIAEANLRLDFAAARELGKASEEQNAKILKGLGLADRLRAKFADAAKAGSSALSGPGGQGADGRPTLTFDGAVKPDKAAKKSAAQKAAEKAAEEEKKFRMKLGRDFAIEEGERVNAAADAKAKALQAIEKDQQKYLASILQENEAQQSLNEKMQEEVQEIGLSKDAVNALRLARLDATIATQEQAFATADAQNASLTELDYLAQRITLLKETRALTARAQVKQADADTAKDQKEASATFAKELNTDLKGAFSSAFRDTSGEPLKAFGDALANVVYTRLATAAAESLAASFTGAALGGAAGGGGIGGLFAALTSFDGGGHTGSGPRAGGLDGKGGFMAMLHPNESVIDHTRSQSAAPPITVVQNFTVGDVASISMVRQAVSGSERRIAAAMGRSMNYGGALA